MFYKFLSASVVAALAVGAALPARAAMELTTYRVNATGNCNGALPSYEGALRKRPVALSNEGNSAAFISCSLPGNYFSATPNLSFGVRFTNQSGSAVTINCTMVDGAVGYNEPPLIFEPKSLELAGGAGGSVAWFIGEGYSVTSNVSCSLPPGVEMNLLEVAYYMDDAVSAP